MASKIPQANSHSRVFDMDSNSSLSNGQLSDALVPHNHRQRHPNSSSRTTDLPSLPLPVVYGISALFLRDTACRSTTLS